VCALQDRDADALKTLQTAFAEYRGRDFTPIDAQDAKSLFLAMDKGRSEGGTKVVQSMGQAVGKTSEGGPKEWAAARAQPVADTVDSSDDDLVRTQTIGGTDITAEVGSYMKLKKLLKAKGLDRALVDSCNGVHQLKLLGIKQGVIRA